MYFLYVYFIVPCDFRHIIRPTARWYSKSRSFPHSWPVTGFVTRLTRRVALVEQDLPTLPGYLTSPQVFSGIRVTRSIDLCVLCRCCLSFCTFSFGHCVVCSHSIYGFWLPPFGIFKLFSWPLCCLFFGLRILIPPLVSSNSSYMVQWIYIESTRLFALLERLLIWTLHPKFFISTNPNLNGVTFTIFVLTPCRFFFILQKIKLT